MPPGFDEPFEFTGYDFEMLYFWSRGHAGSEPRYHIDRYCEQCHIDDPIGKVRIDVFVGDTIIISKHPGMMFEIVQK